MKRMVNIIILPVFALLSLLLTACASRPCPEVRAMPPVVYLQDVAVPEFKGSTNADLAGWALELRTALQLSNSDKAALRVWAGE